MQTKEDEVMDKAEILQQAEDWARICDGIQSQAEAYWLGQLPGETMQKIHEHLLDCGHCIGVFGYRLHEMIAKDKKVFHNIIPGNLMAETALDILSAISMSIPWSALNERNFIVYSLLASANSPELFISCMTELHGRMKVLDRQDILEKFAKLFVKYARLNFIDAAGLYLLSGDDGQVYKPLSLLAQWVDPKEYCFKEAIDFAKYPPLLEDLLSSEYTAYHSQNPDLVLEVFGREKPNLAYAYCLPIKTLLRGKIRPIGFFILGTYQDNRTFELSEFNLMRNFLKTFSTIFLQSLEFDYNNLPWEISLQDLRVAKLPELLMSRLAGLVFTMITHPENSVNKKIIVS